MMREDWIEVELGDVGKILTGNTPPKNKSSYYSDRSYPFYKPTDLDAGSSVLYSIDGLSEEGFKNARSAPEGSILVTCIGATIGKSGLLKKSGAFNQQINGIIPFDIISSNFLYYQVVGFDFQKKIKENASSTTLPILNKSKFSTLRIKIAPLPEQRAIAAKIEQLFSELDNGIANLKTAKSKLEIYRQAILKQAFEGKLTKEWREKQTKNHGNHVNQKNHSTDSLPETWKWVKLENLAVVGTGATPKRGESNYWQNGSIAWITSGALNDLYVKEASEFITEAAIKETNCKIFPKGSLLIAMYGEGKTRGKCSELMISAATNQAIASIEINDEFKEYKKYIKWFLLKNYDDIRMLSSGGVQPNLNLTIVKNTKLPLCPIEKQNQIVQEIETRLSVCDKLNEAIEQSLEKAQALRQSILKKAFEGKLLSEDELQTCRQQTDWEPAAKLLERVRNLKSKK